MNEIIHSGCRHKIDIFYRFLEDFDGIRQSDRRGHPFRQKKELVCIPDGDEGDVILIIIHDMIRIDTYTP